MRTDSSRVARDENNLADILQRRPYRDVIMIKKTGKHAKSDQCGGEKKNDSVALQMGHFNLVPESEDWEEI
jgi:hypothetical protein